jgi:hypothetical protein
MSALPMAGRGEDKLVAAVVAGVVDVEEAGRAGSFEDPALEAEVGVFPFT